jgi:hypothetical protein
MLRGARRLTALAPVLLALLPAPALAAETFTDGFESGDFSAWTSKTTGGDGTATVQSGTVHSGNFAARLTASSNAGSVAQARKTFSSAQADFSASGWFRVETEGPASSNVPLLRLFDAGGARVVSVYRQNQSADWIYVQHSGTYNRTSGKLPLNTWGRFDLRVTGAGTASGTIELRVNDQVVYQASSGSLVPAKTVQIGNDVKAQPFAVVVDDVSATSGSDPPPPPGDPVFVGAGDIADCGSLGDEATAALLDGISGTVFTLGDNVYPDGSSERFSSCYAPSWGRHKARTHPAAGNHEYDTQDAAGYFGYFGAAAGDPTKGYYSYDLGAWHVLVLNSNCSFVGGCGAGSAQEQWLRQDLAAHSAACTLAYWHAPRFSSGGEHGSDPGMEPFWRALYEAGADLVLSGHDHDYERFAPQDPVGNADANYGIREFVVGTGGARHEALATTPVPHSEVRNDDTFGVIKLTLHPSTYDWTFVPEAGKSFTDSGSGSCHGAPPATPPSPTLFADGFESGNFSAWTLVRTGADGSAAVQGSLVHDGAYAARLNATTATGSYAYARKSFAQARTDLTASGWFRVVAEGASGANVPLLRLYDGNGTRLVSLYRQNQSSDRVYVQHSGTYNLTSGKLPLGSWARLQLHVVTAGSASTLEVSLNGSQIYRTTAANLGSSGVATVQIGNDTKTQAFDLLADEIAVTVPG